MESIEVSDIVRWLAMLNVAILLVLITSNCAVRLAVGLSNLVVRRTWPQTGNESYIFL